jgi:phosphoenolpyruvate carboxylase
MDLLLDPDQVPPPRVARSRHRLQVRHGQGHQELPAAQGDVQPMALLQVTLDLLEMVFVKGDPGIATLYDKLLVADDLMPLGEQLRGKYMETQQLLLQMQYSI